MPSIIPLSRDMRIQSADKRISPIDFFSDEELNAIFSEMGSRTDKTGLKYNLLFTFLLRTGGRIDEVLQIRPKDINLDNETVLLPTLKKRTPSTRVIPIHPYLKDQYMRYLLETGIQNNSDVLLFNMKRKAVDKYMKQLGRKLGIHIHAHKFRHTFAVRAIMDGIPLNVVQEWLGHSSIFTTSIYTKIVGLDTREWMKMVR